MELETENVELESFENGDIILGLFANSYVVLGQDEAREVYEFLGKVLNGLE